ncbi:putative zinc-binding metallopeptidase [Maritalea mediterranea]|uniref:Zinc-binding metallopeptidase n=1 Tax=Maritalea mediterranea TaxID=2909667 RepID=A0ABS9EE04_9HYPH|nr:putative zinc-binding metallopeptidase [Maritalea mediterranea]MCF4099633.1 putative zinc-binding metallopeptidase [Maritalea mediterranea]
MPIKNSIRAAAMVFACLSGVSAANAEVCATPPSDKICYAEYPFQERCNPLPDSYAAYPVEPQFDLVFEKSPRIIKDAFCAVEEIRVVKNYHLTGTVAFVRGTTIYFDRQLLFYLLLRNDEETAAPTQYRWNWLNGESRYFEDGNDLELVLKIAESNNWGLRYSFASVLIHELAHIIDTNPAYNSRPNLGLLHCEFAHQALNKSDYQTSTELAGYEAIFSDILSTEESSERLLDLEEAGFNSFYGRNNQFEDFAELFAAYIMLDHFGVSYSITKQDEILFDLETHFEQPALQRKLNIVKTIVNYHALSEAERDAFQKDMLACRGDFTPSLLPIETGKAD